MVLTKDYEREMDRCPCLNQSIKKVVINWPFLYTAAEAQCTVTPSAPTYRQSDHIGCGNNYADSYFELCFFSGVGTLWSLVSPHYILYVESKSIVTDHPATMKTCISLPVADWPK